MPVKSARISIFLMPFRYTSRYLDIFNIQAIILAGEKFFIFIQILIKKYMASKFSNLNVFQTSKIFLKTAVRLHKNKFGRR